MKAFFKSLLFATVWLGVNLVNAQTPSLVLCKGGTVTYNEFNTGSSLPSVAWDWTFQGGVPGTSTLRNPVITYPTAGLYKTTCISTFSNGAKDTNSVYVLIYDGTFSSIPMRDTVLCSKTVSLVLDAGNNFLGNHYVWTKDGSNLPDTLSKLSVSQGGTYKVTITNPCGTTNKTVIVKQGVFPVVDLGPDQFVCHNIAIQLIAGSDPTYSYSWTPTLETTPSITASNAGTYKVTVKSPDGCVSQDQINLIDSCPPVIWLPNAFSPNGYAPNDMYYPYLEGFKSMKMVIYNMWGEKMFETDQMPSFDANGNVLSGAWDGIYMGKPAPYGTYICLLEAVGNDTFRRIIKTDFTLLR